MKIKQDFVTNSSSTSFVMWGKTFFDSDEIIKQIFENNDDPNYDNDPYLIEKYFEKFDLDIQISYDVYYVGKSPFDMKDEMTLGEYKEEIKTKFKNAGVDISDLEQLNMTITEY